MIREVSQGSAKFREALRHFAMLHDAPRHVAKEAQWALRAAARSPVMLREGPRGSENLREALRRPRLREAQ